MFDLVPFVGAGWVVADGDVESGGCGQSGEFEFSQPEAVPVRSTAVGGDEQLCRVRVLELSQLPPLFDGGSWEDRGAVVDSDRDPRAVVGDVVSHRGQVAGQVAGRLRRPPRNGDLESPQVSSSMSESSRSSSSGSATSAFFATTTRCPNMVHRTRGVAVQFRQAASDGRARRTRRPMHCGNTTVSPKDLASVANAKRRSRSFNRGSRSARRASIARNTSSLTATATEYCVGHGSIWATLRALANIHPVELVIKLPVPTCWSGTEPIFAELTNHQPGLIITKSIL